MDLQRQRGMDVMELQLLIAVICTALTVMVCAVYSLYLYRQDAKQWHWYISALIGGAVAYIMCVLFAHVFALSPQLALTLGLVLAALLYALTLFLYARKGRSMKEGFMVVGVGIAVLVVFAFFGNFLHQEATFGFSAAYGAYIGVLAAVRLPTETR